ncbi:MAG: hypothetical protein JWO38_7805 [Gemmataceae bacterium]|nr:hypothetical protein [Gemmataceae bacterium]
MISRYLACFGFVIWAVGLSTLAAEDREPVPDKKAQASAEKALRDLYKKEFSYRSPADRQAFGNKLLQLAAETKDDTATRYILLRESQEIGAQIGDFNLAFRSAEKMTATYDLDDFVLKASILGRVIRGPLKPVDGPKVAELGLVLTEKCVGLDRYDLAAEFATVAGIAATKAGDKELVARCKAKGVDVTATRRKHDEAARAFTRLKGAADDPEANTVGGIFLAFWKGDWEKGLPLLVKGNDEAIEATAKDDLTTPKDLEKQILLGDRWFELARKYPGVPARHLQLRACHWYELAEPNAIGLTKEKIRKRIKEATRDLPGLMELHVTVTVDGTDELKIDAHRARWVHHSFGWPADLALNHVATWEPAKQPELLNAGPTRFLASGVDFAKARVTQLRGRTGVELQKSAEGVTLVFRDDPFGADVYEVVVSFR